MDEQTAFHVALSRAPVVLFAQDAQLRYTWIHNPSYHSAAEILGKTDAEVAPPDAAKLLTDIKAEVLRTGKGTRQEICAELPTGTRYYDLTVQPVRDEDGAISGLTGAAVDITERVSA